MNFQLRLLKLLGRVSRNVEDANEAMKVLAMRPTSTLTITFDRDTLYWTRHGVREGAWNHFLHWYHGRPDSECFVVPHRKGCSMVRRKDILRYEITYGLEDAT